MRLEVRDSVLLGALLGLAACAQQTQPPEAVDHDTPAEDSGVAGELDADAGTDADAGSDVDAGSDGDSDAGNDAGHQPCMPRSCTAAGAECGMTDDGCGTSIDCGACPTSESCVFNMCGCALDGGCGFPSIDTRESAGSVFIRLGAAGNFTIERGADREVPKVVISATDGGLLFIDRAAPASSALKYRLSSQTDAGVYLRSRLSIIGPRANQWRRLGGDNSGAGVNPVEAGKPPLSLSWVIGNGYGGQSPPVIMNGRVFATRTDDNGSAFYLRAIDATDGGTVFDHWLGANDFSGSGQIADLVTTDDSIVLGGCFTQGEQPVRAISSTDGGLLWRAGPICSWIYRGWSGIHVDDLIYAYGVEAYDALEGGLRATASNMVMGESSFGEYEGRLFSAGPQGLTEFNRDDGGVNVMFVSTTSTTMQQRTYPVLAEGRAFFGGKPSIHAVDLTTMQEVWSTPSPVVYSGRMSFYRGVLYAIAQPGALVALDPATGTVLWSWSAPVALVFPPVFAGDYLYVSGNSAIYALDLNTHAMVWNNAATDRFGGELAIADGKLVALIYVVAAYSLTPP